jgi:hypothetical protein
LPAEPFPPFFDIFHVTCGGGVYVVVVLSPLTGKLAYSVDVPHLATFGSHVLEQVVASAKGILALALERWIRRTWSTDGRKVRNEKY